MHLQGMRKHKMDLNEKLYTAFIVGLMFFGVWFIYFCTVNSNKPEKQYYLQKIDEDGTQWFVRMTQNEHQKWAEKRYSKLNVNFFEE